MDHLLQFAVESGPTSVSVSDARVVVFFYSWQTNPKHRKATLWVMLVLFAFSAIPLPVSILQQTQDPATDSTPYPCQGGTCGCRDAKTCWTNCCCRTPKERLAWAAEQGIEPPSYAILRGNDDQSESRALIKKSAAKGAARSCCSSKSEDCCSKTPNKVALCCKPIKQLPEKPFTSQPSVSKQTKWVVWMEAAKCRGLSFDLTSLPVCSIALPVAFQMEVCHCELLLFRSPRSDDIHEDVPHPPPRASFS